MLHYVENEASIIRLEDQILYFSWKKDIEIDLHIARMIVSDRLQLQQGKAYPILCRMNGVIGIDKDAWRYLVGEGAHLIKAVALVSTTPLEDVMSRFFMKRMTTAPIQRFHEVAEAKAFLMPYY